VDEGYQYCGLEAELYDALDELSDFDDEPFFRWFVEANPGPVLDLGCGTGRILLPLAEAGVEVLGVDSSLHMLRLCRRKLEEAGLRAELAQGEMQRLDLGERLFSSILIPGFSFQLLLEDAAARACLAACRRHLRKDGQIVLPFYIPWEMIWDERSASPLEERRRVDAQSGGGAWVAWQGWELDARAQRLKLRNRIECLDAEARVIQREDKEMQMRWYLPHEALALLSQAGFAEVAAYGDFGFDPPEEDSESVVLVGRA